MWMIFNKSVQTVARRDAITKKLGMQRVIKKKEAEQGQWMDGIANGMGMRMEMGGCQATCTTSCTTCSS